MEILKRPPRRPLVFEGTRKITCPFLVCQAELLISSEDVKLSRAPDGHVTVNVECPFCRKAITVPGLSQSYLRRFPVDKIERTPPWW